MGLYLKIIDTLRSKDTLDSPKTSLERIVKDPPRHSRQLSNDVAIVLTFTFVFSLSRLPVVVRSTTCHYLPFLVILPLSTLNRCFAGVGIYPY
jgi:hypothetical protein